MMNFFGSFSSGIIVVALPTIATSISLEPALYAWPSSVYNLTSGATLLLAGSVADLIGARKVDLTGCVLMGIFALACGGANTGMQLVVFRAFQGMALALHLPSSVALVTAVVPAGKSRNIGFASLGMAQPLGFSAGLVVSGIMVEKLGWRAPMYLCGSMTLAVALAGFWALPSPVIGVSRPWRQLWSKVDWIGGGIAGAGLALLSYVLA
jgi:MFS family permease